VSAYDDRRRRDKMKDGRLLILSCVVACLFLTGFTVTVTAKDTLEVIRDKDKTSYVIDSDDQGAREEERDKERAWQMLQNGNMWIDGRGRRQTPRPSDQ
jgi:hypothetical protein